MVEKVFIHWNFVDFNLFCLRNGYFPMNNFKILFTTWINLKYSNVSKEAKMLFCELFLRHLIYLAIETQKPGFFSWIPAFSFCYETFFPMLIGQ